MRVIPLWMLTTSHARKKTQKTSAASARRDAGKDSAMNRWLLIGSLACLLIGASGCLHHNTRGGCESGCSTGACANGACANGGGGHVGAVAYGGGCNNGACNGGACGNGACNGGACGNGACNSGAGGLSGMAGKMAGLCGLCGGHGGCRPGCQAGPLGWQQGGLDYSSHLQTGLLGHTAARNLQSRPFTPGPPTGQVGYPYYTVRGPRDFFLDNPPTIGR